LDPELRHSPLDAAHRALGARFAAFGGWDMPLQYAGVLEEHRACRTHAVVFDVSHLGTLRCAGGGVVDALQWALTNDLGRIAPGRAQYTHLLDEADAHVVDDLIVWWLDSSELLVMPNASNTAPLVAAVRDAIVKYGTDGDTVEDVTGGRAVLAVQGPQARALLAPIAPDAAAVERFHVAPFSWKGVACVAAGTGYTGEDGVEIHVPSEHAPALWDALLAGGVVPAGLGARDTLRLEAALPLHGHELGPGITPLQAGLRWVVRFDKGDFRGRAALEAEQARGVARVLRGMATAGRQPPREGAQVMRDGEDVGTVTSGNFSPTLGHGIALGLLAPAVEIGDRVELFVRGRTLDATVVPIPFVRR
jgi:aminomethyltransferase